MSKIKVACIFGTRPEAVKMAPVIQRLKNDTEFECAVIITAQHRFMLDQVLETFGILPDFDLNIMKDGQTLADITSRILTSIGGILRETAPDIALVHGDTTTTFAAALASFYSGVKVGHVEAGLRSFDKRQPYPEEMNRLLTTRLSDVHFAPTNVSKQNLLNENVDPRGIFVTGNTVIDALRTSVNPAYVFSDASLRGVDFGKRVIAMTAHRRENIGKPLESIFAAVNDITAKFDDVFVVYAVHKNPAVSVPAHDILGGNPRVLLTEPLNIDDMHNLIARSELVLTDSGGLQEEAPALGKPVVVLRNVTERPEGLETGTLTLAGCERENIVDSVSALLDDREAYEKMANAKNPFGDGRAAERIAEALLYYFGKSDTRPVDYAWK